MRYLLSLIFCCLFFIQTVDAQSINYKMVDSLLQAIKTQKNDSTKAKSIFALATQYFAAKPDSALYYYTQLGILSEQIQYPTGVIDHYLLAGKVHSNIGKIDTSILLLKKAIEAAKKYKRNKALAISYLGLCYPYLKNGNFQEAANYALQAEKISAASNDSGRLSDAYSSLAYAFNNLKNYNRAYDYGRKSVEINRLMKRKQNLMTSMINLAGTMIYLQKFDSSIVVYKEAETIAKELDDQQNLLIIESGFVYAYERMGRYEMIKPYAEKELAIAKPINFPEGTVIGLLGMGDAAFYNKDYKEANRYALMALDSIKKYDLGSYIKNNYLFLTYINVGLGNFKDFEYYGNLRDSVEAAQQSEQNIKTSQEMEAKYGSEIKQASIDKLDKENKIKSLEISHSRSIIWLLIAVAIIIALLGFVYYRNIANKKKLLEAEKAIQQQQIAELEKEKQLMATQAMLQGQEDERTRMAKDLHDGLGGILSGVKYSLSNMKDNMIITSENADRFERTMGMLDQSITELRRVAHNMMPESLMKLGLETALEDICHGINQSGKLNLKFQSFELDDATIPKNTASVIYRIIQELLNNMLKHAGANEALLQLVRSGNALSITVEDNGKGFNKEILQSNSGIGFSNLQNRITYLKGNLDIQTAPGNGTSVNIEIPDVTV